MKLSTALCLALAGLVLAAHALPVEAQAGRRYYCGSGENTATCGPSAAPGLANSCGQAACHGRNPSANTNNVLNGAGSVATILGSRDQGMQAALGNYSMAELDAIASWLLTLTQGGGSPPSCSVSASETSVTVGSSVTLVASCTNRPTSYAWSGCTSGSSTCSVTQNSAGTRTYAVTATNASGSSAPASVSVTWTIDRNPGEPEPPTAVVVEYFHAGFGHYFVTRDTGEIGALDAGIISGWARTGRTFRAYTATNGAQAAVCRFFTVAFAPKSSHFYTPNGDECEYLKANNPNWIYENIAFWVAPAAATGACPAGTQAVYRLYNNGQTGAPNHRYTTDPGLRAEMMGAGWVPEGSGPDGVSFCAPL